MRVLIVEDEKYLGEAIASVLKKNNYSVDLVYDGQYGLDCALTSIYDIIILDIMLPKKDGISVLKEIRQNKVTSFVILLTAKGETEDKIIGLDSGADDYLSKPFPTEELLARLRALARRTNTELNDNTLSFGDIILEPFSLTLICYKKQMKLTLKECHLLELLIKRKNQSVSKNAIIEKLWGFDSDMEDNHVEVYISFIRKKLSHIKSKVNIKTIRGIGYILEE